MRPEELDAQSRGARAAAAAEQLATYFPGETGDRGPHICRLHIHSRNTRFSETNAHTAVVATVTHKFIRRLQSAHDHELGTDLGSR